MAKYSSSINYKITTSLDASGITKLQAELNKLEHELGVLNKRPLISDPQTQEAIRDIQRIQNALKEAFNPKLGMVNSRVLMNELTKGGRSLADIYDTVGKRSTSAMTQLYGQLAKVDTGMKSVSKTTDKVFNTLGNTVRWGLIASGFQYILNGAHSAVQYMADLDKSLTNIRLVTDESKESMREFAKYANDAAKSLGNTTVAYTDAALIYAQQGYGLSDQKTLANYTLMTANVTGQDTAEVSEQMTAIINGFQLSVEDVGSALDVMAKVANTSAADLEELATAASKVASTANTLGVTQEQLTAQIATIVSVTREAPENVGNALKTIYARFGDLSLGETLEDGTDLGKVSSTLQKIGVQVLDSSGAMRDMGLIMEDLMAVWDTLDTATKQGAAVTLAGKYQYNRLMALMENSDMYEGYYDDAINSAGTLEEMQSEYMESLEGKANALKASFEGLLSDLFNQDDFGVVIEGLTEIIDLFDSLIEAIGGGGAALTAFGAIGMNVFSNQIGRGIANIVSNREKSAYAQQNIMTAKQQSEAGMLANGVSKGSERMQNFGADLDNLRIHAGIMNDEQLTAMNQKIDEYAQAVTKAEQAQKTFKEGAASVAAAFDILGISADKTTAGLVASLQEFEAGDAELDDLENTLGGLLDKITNTQMAVTRLSNAFSQLDVNDENVSWERLLDNCADVRISMQELVPVFEKMGAQSEDIDKINTALAELQATEDGVKVNTKQLAAILDNAGLSVNDFRVALEKATEKGLISSQQLQQWAQECKAAAFAADGTRQSVIGMTDALANQSFASNLANVASGAMSLMFALQSLSSFGEILTDKDLQPLEKLGQLAMNGTMTITMLAMAYVELSRGFKELKTTTGAATVAEGALFSIRMALGAATDEMIKKETALAIARKDGDDAAVAQITEEIKQLKESQKAMSTKTLAADALKTSLDRVKTAITKIPGPLKAVGVVLGVAAVAWGVYQQHIENTRKAIEEELERTSKAAETRKELTTTFNETYEAYKKGNASEVELTKAAEALNEQLNDQQLAVAAAAGEWENYNKQLKNALNTADQEQLGSLIGAKEFYSDRVSGDWGNTAIGGGFFTTFATQGASQAALGQMQNETTAISRNYRGEYNWDASSTPVERVRDYAKAVEILNNELAELNTAYSNGQISQETYNNSLREVNNELTNLKRLETEDFTAYRDSLSAPAELQAAKIQESLGNTSDYQSIIDAYFSDAQTKDYLESLTNWSDQLQWIISQTTNETQKLALMLQQGYETASTKIQDIIKASPSSVVDTEGNALTDDWAIEAVTNDVLDKIKNSGLSDEQQLKFLASIDENASLGEILQQLEELKQNPEIIEALTFKPTLTNRMEETDASINALLEDTDFSENAFNRMSSDIYNSDSGYFAQARANLPGKEDIAELTDYYESGNLTLEEYNDKLKDITSAQSDLAQEAKDVAAQNLRLNKGVEKLCDSWEDYGKILKDDASKGTSDWYEALATVDEAMSDILNIDIGTLSNDFYQNTEAIAAMEAAANGDKDAIDELRKIASQDIIQNLQITPVGDEDVEVVRAELAGLAQQLQTDLDAMPLEERVTATLDDSEFTIKLNEMLANSQITAEQASNILSSMGMSGTLKTKKVEGKVPKTVYKTTFSDFDEKTGWPQTITTTPETTLVPQTMEVPYFEGTHYTGPGITSVGGNSGGGSSGGGGGGGGSSYTPKAEKKSDAKADRYQNVNAHLDRLSGSFEKVADEQDRLAGKDMLENMEKQVELIQQQAEWHQKKLEIQQQEAAELQKELSDEYGITFDEDGFMQNYEAMFNKFKDDYDALVDKYNAATTEEAQEKIKEEMDALKEKWDAFNESIERYDELMNNEIPESEKMLEELEDQIEDIRIAMLRAKVEAADSIKEIKDAWADYMGFMSGLDPDSPFRSLIEDAEKYENTLGRLADGTTDFEYLYSLLPQYLPGGTISNSDYGENSKAFYEDLKAAYELYIELALEAEQLYYQQIDDIIAAYDDIVDRISQRMESYARLTEQLDHYASMVEMIYGEEDYDKLLALKRANQDVLESSIKQSAASLEMLEQELAKMEAMGAPQEIIDDLKNKVVEAEQELEGLMEEAAQSIAEILEMAVDKTVKEWKDSMLGGDADWMETQWELAKRNAEQYLDTVEETYEIEKLRSKYNSLANDTMDLNIRRRINDQMQRELAYLEEKDKLSEYDVNYANAKLEILQKQIALEEAQANKNQMKLRRDSQGNYSYVYAGDQDNIEQARSELLDAEYNAYSISKENYTSNYDNYIAAISQAAEQIKAINADTSLSEEEKAKRTQAIYDNLSEYLKGVAEQIGVSEQNMIEAVKHLAMDSGEIVGQTYADIAKMMEEDWTEALGAIGVAVSKEFDSIIHNIDKFLADTEEKWGEFEDHSEEWAQNIKAIAEDGTSGFLDIDKVIIDINKDMEDLNKSTEEFLSLIGDDLGVIEGATGKLLEYQKQIKQLQEDNVKLVEELERARAAIEAKDRAERGEGGEEEEEEDGGSNNTSPADDGPNLPITSPTPVTSNGYAGTSYSQSELLEGIAGNVWNIGDWGNNPGRKNLLTKKFNETVAKQVQAEVDKGYSAFTKGSNYYKKFAPSQFDTGGYTGAWGGTGKLAMLHQKELVLNASDTENILNAVSIMRDLVAAMKSDSVQNIFSVVGGNHNIAGNTGHNIQQNVEIYADFPAVESAAEIKAALEGLAQQAVQYSFKEK